MSRRADLADYFALTKPAKIYRFFMSAGFGVLVALPIPRQEWPHIIVALAAGAIAAAGGNAINMFVDRNIDAADPRTASRPVASGRVTPQTALLFGIALTTLGLAMLAVFVSPAVAALALLTGLLYATVYGWLKRSTPYYTLFGGVIWAAPVIIIWIAAGKPLSATPLSAASVCAFWTALHVWSAALVRAEAERPAGPRFMPRLYGSQATRLNLFLITLFITASTIVLRRWGLMPFDAMLVAAAAASVSFRSGRADKLLSRASMLYICGFAAVCVAGAL
ncbi:MAG: UbiA family prenyltransferase [Candidatus Eremiobacteraeota bacterium]|nr:UbiA family prenyltransferase [Candidatus Eremiobacteraeota bacterium]